MAAIDNVLVSLSGFNLPADLPWRVRFVQRVEAQLRRLPSSAEFKTPRFFGYFFRGGDPVAVTGDWTVLLDSGPELEGMRETVEDTALGRFSISAESDGDPDFMLVHDRHDGSCWLWRYAYGLRFVTTFEPIFIEEGAEDADEPDAED